MAWNNSKEYYQESCERLKKELKEVREELWIERQVKYDARLEARKEFENEREALQKREAKLESEIAKEAKLAAENKCNAIMELAKAFATGKINAN